MCGIFHVCVKRSQRLLILLYIAGCIILRKMKNIPLASLFHSASFGVSYITITITERELMLKVFGEVTYNQSINFGDAIKE